MQMSESRDKMLFDDELIKTRVLHRELKLLLTCPFVCLGSMLASHRHVAIDVDENSWMATTDVSNLNGAKEISRHIVQS